MKTLLTSILLLGFVQLTYSQIHMAYTENINPTDTKGPERNYVRTNSELSNASSFLADKSKQLQMQVLNYDIKSAGVYSTEVNTTYTVSFTEGNNHIDAVYAKDGSLIQSEGVFENVPVPYSIGYQLAKTYPGWEFHKSWCYSTYDQEKSPEIVYKIQLKKGNKTKIIKVNPLQ